MLSIRGARTLGERQLACNGATLGTHFRRSCVYCRAVQRRFGGKPFPPQSRYIGPAFVCTALWQRACCGARVCRSRRSISTASQTSDTLCRSGPNGRQYPRSSSASALLAAIPSWPPWPRAVNSLDCWRRIDHHRHHRSDSGWLPVGGACHAGRLQPRAQSIGGIEGLGPWLSERLAVGAYRQGCKLYSRRSESAVSRTQATGHGWRANARSGGSKRALLSGRQPRSGGGDVGIYAQQCACGQASPRRATLALASATMATGIEKETATKPIVFDKIRRPVLSRRVES